MHTDSTRQPRWKARLLHAAVLMAFVFTGACRKADAPAPEKAGRILHTSATETSGLAASRRAPDLLWIHNDSNGQPLLYAIGTDGRLRGTLRVQGVRNVDWEDLASFELDGKSWLLVADTGNNSGRRKDCSILVLPEPDPNLLSPTNELVTQVAWRRPVTFPGTPRDCEAVAVDPREEKVYLVTKRTSPPLVYSLPLRAPSGTQIEEVELVAQLNHIPQPNSEQRLLPTPTGRFRAFVTGADIASNGSGFALLTYGDVLWFPRRPGENWSTALGRPPTVFAPHKLPQAEAIGLSRDNQWIYVSSERKDPLLLRYKVPANRPE